MSHVAHAAVCIIPTVMSHIMNESCRTHNAYSHCGMQYTDQRLAVDADMLETRARHLSLSIDCSL